ncbi:hypothetical protein [Companilactobacillus mishanensis]|uniref:Uncharacterized protein n=1 Tax=Companilactobacillus mishanensis TaxID=2486008 RepID=A0A5P0ZFI5_9LACO|nr:hypothetical protein [Companilactobacillus mishanensis]MQS45931.1 hypothetical protein [Companilactobacillus mishanensis]MQS51806.1 hypothetical protein [Companilactobacillus mishanensis]MQS89077.1 hypothetical protein [Companilactobacillus mishanensis]
MRIIDLILMLNDFKKNNRVYIEEKDARLAVVDLEVKEDGIYLKSSTKIQGIKNWEFLLLLNKKEYYTLPLYYDDDRKKNHQQLFGFRVADDCILLG